MKAFNRIPMFKRICVLFLFFSLVACAKPAGGPKLETINMAFQKWVGYGPFYLADEKGFFKEKGIRVEFINEELDSARKEAFKQDMLDCEAGTIDLLVAKTSQDTPISAVMGLDHSYGSDGIVALEDIKKVEDLIGRRVAFARDDVGETFISYLFYEKGLSLNDVIIIPTGPDEAWKYFIEGKADAVVTWQPFLSKALKRPGSHLLTSTKENPDIIVDTLNFRRDIIQKNPELVKKLMKAWYRAVQYYEDHPEEASAIVAKYFNLTPEEYREQVKGLLWVDYKEVRAGKHGSKKAKKIFNFISKIKLNAGRIHQLPDADKAIDFSLWKNLYENSQ